jgi:hypothetical protein
MAAGPACSDLDMGKSGVPNSKRRVGMRVELLVALSLFTSASGVYAADDPGQSDPESLKDMQLAPEDTAVRIHYLGQMVSTLKFLQNAFADQLPLPRNDTGAR